MSPGFYFSRLFSPPPHMASWVAGASLGALTLWLRFALLPIETLHATQTVLYSEATAGLLSYHALCSDPMNSSQLRAELEAAACHLLSIVGIKALILGHSEHGFPVPCDACGSGREGGSLEVLATGRPRVAQGSSSLCSRPRLPDAPPGGRSPFLMKGEMLWSMISVGTVLWLAMRLFFISLNNVCRTM